jgi:hypothetical protein
VRNHVLVELAQRCNERYDYLIGISNIVTHCTRENWRACVRAYLVAESTGP